jgi:hypothetical protein
MLRGDAGLGVNGEGEGEVEGSGDEVGGGSGGEDAATTEEKARVRGSEGRGGGRGERAVSDIAISEEGVWDGVMGHEGGEGRPTEAA